MAAKAVNVPAQITAGHSVMLNVLENRLLRLKAALTFWKKHDIVQLIAYLMKINDDGLFIDIFPFITKRIAEDDSAVDKQVTMGACFELLPIVQRLIHKQYENYQVVCLDFMRTTMKRWYTELRAINKGKGNLHLSLSTPLIHANLLAMSKAVEKITKREGKVQQKAKVVYDMLHQLEQT